MTQQIKQSRRQMLGMGVTALAVFPLSALPDRAFATQNAAIRAALKYQLTPNGSQKCAVCVNFVPNMSQPNNNSAVNGCKLYAGDTEICPSCYCSAFVQNPAATAGGPSWSPWTATPK